MEYQAPIGPVVVVLISAPLAGETATMTMNVREVWFVDQTIVSRTFQLLGAIGHLLPIAVSVSIVS